MGNIVRKLITKDTSWTANPGVKFVRLVSIRNPTPCASGVSQGSGITILGAISVSGNTYLFGQNANGSLGVGDTTPRSSPTLVLGGLNFEKIYTENPCYGITAAGFMYSWGANGSGVLGLGDTTPRSSPVLITSALTFQSISGGGPGNPGALSTTGAAYAWGLNNNGQLGTGNTTNVSVPTAVAGGLTFRLLSVTTSVMAAIDLNGNAYQWGLNTNGQLGVGDVASRSSPVSVLGGLTFKSINVMNAQQDSGQCSSYGITSAGVLYAWGMNDKGQLGVGDVTPRSSPVAVLGGLTVDQVFMLGDYGQVFVLTTGGDLYAMGDNRNGSLGVGDVASRSSPVLVLGGQKWQNVQKAFDTVGPYILGLNTSGALYAWGSNANGQLGLGDVTPRSSPVAVLGSLSVAQMRTTVGLFSGVMAVTTAGLLYAWGHQPCNANSIPTSSPVLVPGSLTANLIPSMVTSDIAVTPGTTYSIKMQEYLVLFGNIAVARGPLDSLILEYYD